MMDERLIEYVTCDRCGGDLGDSPGTLGWDDGTTQTLLQICTECRAEIDEFIKPSPLIEAVNRPIVSREGHALLVAMYDGDVAIFDVGGPPTPILRFDIGTVRALAADLLKAVRVRGPRVKPRENKRVSTDDVRPSLARLDARVRECWLHLLRGYPTYLSLLRHLWLDCNAAGNVPSMLVSFGRVFKATAIDSQGWELACARLESDIEYDREIAKEAL